MDIKWIYCYNLSTEEAEAGRLLQDGGQPVSRSKILCQHNKTHSWFLAAQIYNSNTWEEEKGQEFKASLN